MKKATLFKKSFLNRLFFSLLIVFIIAPIIFITYYGYMPGRIIGTISYMLIAMIGYFEILRVIKISKISSMIGTLIIPAFVLLNFNYFKGFVIFGNDTPIANSIANALNSWESWIVVIIFVFIPFISDYILYNSGVRIKQLLTMAIISILVPIFTKTIWIMNVEGFKYVLFFVGIAICSDTFSYVGGLLFGKKWFKGAKFAPKISPKKTWAGYFVGSTLTAIYAVLVGYFAGIWSAFNSFELLVSIIFGIFIALLTPYGDLLFSWIKRSFKVKDFSNLIPGHGGIFDRIDSMSLVIFVSSMVYLLANIT